MNSKMKCIHMYSSAVIHTSTHTCINSFIITVRVIRINKVIIFILLILHVVTCFQLANFCTLQFIHHTLARWQLTAYLALAGQKRQDSIWGYWTSIPVDCELPLIIQVPPITVNRALYGRLASPGSLPNGCLVVCPHGMHFQGILAWR